MAFQEGDHGLGNLQRSLQQYRMPQMLAASRRLHVTQSTVTARMNTLEEDIGQKLLRRGKAGAELTSSGFKFQRYAELMMQLWHQARHEVSLPAGFNGVCNIGLEFDLWPGVAQIFIDRIQGVELKIAAAVWPAEQMQLSRWLRMGLIDLAFCFNPQSAEISPAGFHWMMNSFWSLHGEATTISERSTFSWTMARNFVANMPRHSPRMRQR